ncbi:MAG TPA: ABC transporter permease [Vicinamibacterales bacterium]|nr:ABC transporter permease [Vicinamibacterales bacterium]
MSVLRQAIRTLRKSPGFSALVVIVLAVGIGANTAIFSIVDGVLLKPLPFAGAGRLVAVDTVKNNEPDDSAYPDFVDWRAQVRSFDRLAAYATAAVTLTGVGDAASLPCAVVSSDLFPMLGVRSLLGRAFTTDDDKPGAARTAVLAESTWTKYFSRDPAIVGRSIVLDGDAFTVIGVMPASFEFPFDGEDPSQLWIPIRASRFASQWADQRGAQFLKVIGRLRDGVDLPAAQADATTVAAGIAAQYPETRNRGVVVRPFRDVLVKDYRLGLVVLLAAVAAVLLIACANIANLLLARGSTRRREIAVRIALGATRGDIVRQLLAESLALAVVGGIAGAVLALWGVDLLVRISPLQIPRLHAVRVDRSALLFTALASMLTGALSGLVPAFQLSRAHPGDALKDGDRGGSGAAGTRTRQTLVVAEMAISLVLLAAAGLLVRSLIGLQRVSPGFVTERAVAMQLLLPGSQYPNAGSMRAFYRRLHDEAIALPGIASAAISTTLPMTGNDISAGFAVEGRPVDPNTRTSAPMFSISPEYFASMGIPLIKGRRFSDHDNDKASNVVIVSEAFAAKYWPGEDPIGKRMTISYNNTGPREVVGLVGNVKQSKLSERARPQMYTPFEQTPWPFLTVVIQTTAAPESAAGALRGLLTRVDPMQGAGEIRTLEQYITRSVAAPRFTTLLVGAFAVVALLLAGFGLFSVMAYSVSQRRREIGIRMAIGAESSDVRRLVVGQAIRMGAVGLGIGLAGAFVVARSLGSLLYGVGPGDPATFTGVSAMLLAVMLLAAYLPARRATRVDPMTALRTE